MANILQNLLVALLLAATSPARAQSDLTGFTCDFSESATPLCNTTYEGDAQYQSDSTYLLLTKTDSSGLAQPVSTGRVLYSKPVKIWDQSGQANFATTLIFIINPNPDDEYPGDGLAFFIAPVGSTPGAAGGWLGVFDSSGEKQNTFAVEFDIFYNSGVDPSSPHIGIDIENIKSSNVTEMGDALLGQVVTAVIRYEASTKLITAKVKSGSKTFEVSYVCDLSTILDQQVQVGISSATGGAVAVHNVIWWQFSSKIQRNGAGREEE